MMKLLPLVACLVLAAQSACASAPVLQSLQFGMWRLHPEFSPATKEYSFMVPNNLNMLPFRATFDAAVAYLDTGAGSTNSSFKSNELRVLQPTLPVTYRLRLWDENGAFAAYSIAVTPGCAIVRGQDSVSCPPERPLLLGGGVSCSSSTITSSRPASSGKSWTTSCQQSQSNNAVAVCCNPDTFINDDGSVKSLPACSFESLEQPDGFFACSSSAHKPLMAGGTCASSSFTQDLYRIDMHQWLTSCTTKPGFPTSMSGVCCPASVVRKDRLYSTLVARSQVSDHHLPAGYDAEVDPVEARSAKRSTNEAPSVFDACYYVSQTGSGSVSRSCLSSADVVVSGGGSGYSWNGHTNVLQPIASSLPSSPNAWIVSVPAETSSVEVLCCRVFPDYQ